jgi:C1A family cysteine protease
MTLRSRSLRLSRPSAVIALVATALVPFLSAPFAQAAEATTAKRSTSVAVHTLGLKTLPGARISAGRRVSALGIAAADVLPTTVDLTAKTVTPGNQGPIGSCVAWSEGYTLAGYYANAQSQPGSPYAPMYLYSQVHVSSSADGGGAYTSAAWNVLSSQGIAEKSVYTQGDFNFTTMPTAAQIANAAGHKMSPASYLFSGANQSTAGIAALKGALASGNPVEIGIPVYSPFNSLNTTKSVMTAAMATGAVLGGHAIVAVGYNPTGLVIENSWGTGWGAGGYATLAWDFVGKYVSEASVTTGFTAVPVPPVVNGLSVTSSSTAGGGSLIVTGAALAPVDASSISAVTLVNVANPSVSVNAPVTSRTATSLTVSIPAAPVVAGKAVSGAYRVRVTSPAGASTDNGTKDDFTYVAPAEFAVSGPSTIAAGTGGPVVLTGSGFGASAAETAAQKLAATVAGKSVLLTWIDDTSVKIAVPAGVPGQSIPIVLSRAGIVSATDSSLKYAANISAIAVRPEASGARYAAVTGRGLAGATGWVLTAPDGSHTTALPVVTDSAALAAAAGVLITGDTAAQIRLPAYPVGGAGTFRVSFTPNQTAYPGASFLATSGAVVAYSAPTITKLTGAVVSAAGGSVLTVTGTNLAAVDRTTATSVRLINSANSAVGVNVPVTDGTGTTLTLAVPAAPMLAGVRVIGDYQLVVTTAQGTVTAASAVTYVTPFTISAAAGSVLLAPGAQALIVRGSGFGTTLEEFRAQTVTAVLSGRPVAVTWVNDTTVRVAATFAGTPGTTGGLVVSRRGIASNNLTLTYVAAISAASVTTGPSTGGTLVTVKGAGFAGSSVWSVRTLGGVVLAPLAQVTSSADLDAAASGVFVSTDGIATVKMPAAASAGLSAVAIGFNPDLSLYASATSVTTSKAVFVYSDIS